MNVMHVLVRTVPFNVKRMRSRVNHIAPSSVHNEMNRVTAIHVARKNGNQRGSTTGVESQGIVSVTES